jgi:hypothetical protein
VNPYPQRHPPVQLMLMLMPMPMMMMMMLEQQPLA